MSGMFQPQRDGIFIVSEPQNVSSSVGAALNRTCRPAGAFCDWRVIYYKYAAPAELTPLRFRLVRKDP